MPRFLLPLLALLITAQAAVVELPKLLQNGIPHEQVSADGSVNLIFRLVLPTGVQSLDIDTSGGTGDCDVFVRFGVHPTTDDYDKSSEGFSNKEHVHLSKPKAGVHYVMLYAARIFDGVRLTARYQREPDADNVPKLLPGPGNYAGPATLTAKTKLATGKVRYTTNGTDPLPTSPALTKPLTLTADTELRVQTYDGLLPRGPVLVAPYFIRATGTITTLQSGVLIQHLAGMIGSEALFKITVPANQKRLQILTRGGTGDSTLFLRRGQTPTRTEFDHKKAGFDNRADITLNAPAAGDYFILLRGRGHYSGLILQATHRTKGPDLVVWAPTLEPYISTETFAAEECEVEEGLITAGTHRLMRFSTESRNLGGGALNIGSPVGKPGFEYFECHMHYHFNGFASYVLRYKNGTTATTGRKVSFCLEDVSRWDPEAPRSFRFDCENQGIQAGWSDIYDSGLPGQWIDITGLPAGDYDLEVTINPDHLLEEADYTNNTTIVPVSIPPE